MGVHKLVGPFGLGVVTVPLLTSSVDKFGAVRATAGGTATASVISPPVPLLFRPLFAENAVGGGPRGAGTAVSASENKIVVTTATAVRAVAAYGERRAPLTPKTKRGAAAVPSVKGAAGRALRQQQQTRRRHRQIAARQMPVVGLTLIERRVSPATVVAQSATPRAGYQRRGTVESGRLL